MNTTHQELPHRFERADRETLAVADGKGIGHDFPMAPGLQEGTPAVKTSGEGLLTGSCGLSSHRVALLGAGRMGSWFAGILNGQCPLAVWDQDPAKAGRIPGPKVLSHPRDLRQFSPTLLVNAVNLHHTEEAFRAVTPYLPSNCILADVMSVKGGIEEYYRTCGRPFLSFHPMFGPESTDLNSLVRQNVVIIRESDPGAMALVKDLMASLGFAVHVLSFREHDMRMAETLTLPFALSMLFTASMEGNGVFGTTFIRHKLLAQRVLSESDDLLAEVLFNPFSQSILRRIQEQMEQLRFLTKNGDPDVLIRHILRLRRQLRHEPS